MPILRFEDAMRGAGRARPRAAAHAVRRQGLRLHLASSSTRAVAHGSWAASSVETAWKLVDKMPVHYNIGHIAAAEGDTVSRDGKYLVAMNKWAIDRFVTGRPAASAELPAHRHRATTKMQLLYDMPIGSASRTTRRSSRPTSSSRWCVYPEVGWDPHAQAESTRSRRCRARKASSATATRSRST